jgi:hypothetical protein
LLVAANLNRRKGTIMSGQLTNYLWFDSYLNAICETDDTKQAGRILEARSALEERLLSPVGPGSDEEKAIETAQTGLKKLAAERVNQANHDSDDFLQGVPS